jgi:arsenical pump membrane protein
MLLPVTGPSANDRTRPAGDASPGVPRRRALFGGLVLAVTGVGAALAAAVTNPGDAGSAASQVWSPFVLVAGLLLIGLVADADGLFAAAGHTLARAARNGVVLYAGSMLLVAVVTAVLNLDTSVAFLTPVLVYTARSRGEGHAPLLYGCLLLSNAASLALPGSNLTNLIVLGHLHLSGGRFLAQLWPAALAAALVTATVVAICERRSLRATVTDLTRPDRPRLGVGLFAVVAAATLVVVLRSPALPVAALGAIAAGVRVSRRVETPARVAEVVGLPVLIGLFGVAIALGTLGRAWSGPATVLSHVNSAATAALAAAAAVLVNNLPAAALLAARVPPRPYALLVGLNLGPNLFMTGSLAWILWRRAARTAGAQPSMAHASRLGAIAVPLSLAAALGALALTGAH